MWNFGSTIFYWSLQVHRKKNRWIWCYGSQDIPKRKYDMKSAQQELCHNSVPGRTARLKRRTDGL